MSRHTVEGRLLALENAVREFIVEIQELQAVVAADKRERPYWEECGDLVLSRKDARNLELPRYRTGEACVNGHRGWRFVSTGGCCDCLKKDAKGRSQYERRMHRTALKAADYCRKSGQMMPRKTAKWLDPSELWGVELYGAAD